MASTVNTRIQEFDFLISIMNDLCFKYPQHNKKLLENLIQTLQYMKENEENTVIAKSICEDKMREKQLHKQVA